VSAGEPHKMGRARAHIRASTESTSASSLSLFVSFSIRFFPSSGMFLSFGIYRIMVANRRQSSPSIFWTESQHRSLNLAHAFACGTHMRDGDDWRRLAKPIPWIQDDGKNLSIGDETKLKS
jgi:hypothetical protein